MNIETFRAENLSVGYSGKPIVKNVSFTVQAGEVCALLGPNGSGKTTLLRSLAGILRPISGSIFVNEKNVESMRDIMAKLGSYVPQSIDGRPKITVLEYVLLGIAISRGLLGVKREDVDTAYKALVMLGIENLAIKNVDELSSGQRRLADIAQALAKKPRFLLLDEPTSSLDIKNSFEVLETIRMYTKTEGLITVISVHDLNQAMEFADKCLVLNSGELAAFGKSSDILSPQLIEKVYGVYVEKIYVNRHTRLVVLKSKS
jgi:iron complex transport system ATP-binding protein